MTVDVEDYFQVSAFTDIVPADSWPSFESRVCRNTDRLIEIFRKADVHGTFFVLGWVAERFPDLVRRIRDAGHELASHVFGNGGHGHPGGMHAGGMQPQHDAGAGLLSADLLGEIDGTGGHHAAPGAAPRHGADPTLSLPADDASLFSPPSAPLTGLPGAAGGFRSHSMW
jgi:hypothetical protein